MFSVMKYGTSGNCWQYVCKPNGKPALFEKTAELVAFFSGCMVAEARHKEHEQGVHLGIAAAWLDGVRHGMDHP